MYFDKFEIIKKVHDFEFDDVNFDFENMSECNF